jgi:hypothetical protein
MNTKILMTITSFVLAAAGALALFAPEIVLTQVNAQVSAELMVLGQLLGALYFSFALMNWTAKDSAIGGIYARPVSLGNFGHFLTGSLLLAKYLFSNPFSVSALLIFVVYAVFALAFYWLVFHATGLKAETK